MNPTSPKMRTESIAGHRIFRPREERERLLAAEAHDDAYAKFGAMDFSNLNEIDEVVKYLRDFWRRKLEVVLPRLASIGVLDFLCLQFDLGARIDYLFLNRLLSVPEHRYWSEIGPTFLRAIQFLAESCTILIKSEDEPQFEDGEFLDLLDAAWFCAERLVDFSIISDQCVFLCDFTARISIPHPSTGREIEFVCDPRLQVDYRARVARDGESRRETFSQPIFEFRKENHDAIVGTALTSTIGTTFLGAIGYLGLILKNCKPAEEGAFNYVCSRAGILSRLIDLTGVSRDTIEKVVDGFTIDAANLRRERRDYWDPKRHHRSFRRGFFRVPTRQGDHLVWSSEMASQSLAFLVIDIAFGLYPEEWHSNEVSRAVEALRQSGTRWFESETERNLKLLGFKGKPSQQNRFGTADKRINLPVGQLDFFGYSEREELLVLLECKMLRSGTEPKWWRREVTDFVSGDRSYAQKLRSKAHWVLTNMDAVCEAAKSVGIPVGKPTKLATAMITYFPSVATYLIDDFPCVSLTELVLDYQEKGVWPYQNGLHQIA